MSRRRSRQLVSLAAALLLSCVALAGCASTNRVELNGNVVDDVVSVQAPAIPVPSPDLEAGFRTGGPGAGGASGSGGGGASKSATPTVAGITGLGSFVRVDAVEVRAGEQVAAGQLLAVLDSRLLDSNVAAARAAQRVARAQVPVVQARLDDLASKRSDIASTRATVSSTIADLRATRARLAAQLGTLEATLRRVENLPAFPPGGVPTTMPPGGIPTSTPGGGGIPGGLPGGGGVPPNIPSPAKLRAGIAQLRSAIARIDAGIAQAENGLGKLSSASARISDARAQLRHLRTLARIAATASSVGVDLARYQRSLAEVRSPVAGVVVSVVSAGDVIAPGATVAQIRRTGAGKVTAWLPPADLRTVSLGAKATVNADWLDGQLEGRVTRIGTGAEFPPTSSATKEVHLTRGVPIEVTVDARQGELAAGAPVDISIARDDGGSGRGQ